MNQRGISFAVFFGFALLLLAGFIYLSIFQASKAFLNQEPERPAFEIIRANTQIQTTRAYLRQAAQYSLSHALITFAKENMPACAVIVNNQEGKNQEKQYSVLNKTCFTLPLVAEQLKQEFGKEFGKHIASHNERTKKQGLYTPEKHIYTIFNNEKTLAANAIAIDDARVPVISPAQDNHPESIYYQGYNIPFPATNLIPAYIDYTIETESSYKRIGYLYYKPSAAAEIQFSLNKFINAYNQAEQLIAQCAPDKIKKEELKLKELTPADAQAIDTVHCLETNKPQDWQITLTPTPTHALFTAPLGEIDGKLIEFRFGIELDYVL